MSENKVSSLSQAADNSKFDLLIETVRAVAEFSEGILEYKKCSLASKFGYSIKKCTSLLANQASIGGDQKTKERYESFCRFSLETGMIKNIIYMYVWSILLKAVNVSIMIYVIIAVHTHTKNTF